MSDPTNKADLMRLVREEREKLEAAIGALSDAQLTEPGLEGGWSVKDVMAHLAYWEGSMLDRIRRAAGGERIVRPALSDEEQAARIDRINAEAYAAARERPLAEVRAAFERSYREVLDSFEALSEAQIFDQSQISAMLGYPVTQLMAGDTYEHYREHREAIEAWRKGAGGQ